MTNEVQRFATSAEFGATTLLLVSGFDDSRLGTSLTCDDSHLVGIERLLRRPDCLMELLPRAALDEVFLADQFWGDRWFDPSGHPPPIDIHWRVRSALKSLIGRGLVQEVQNRGEYRITPTGRLTAQRIASDNTWGAVWWRIRFMGRYPDATRHALSRMQAEATQGQPAPHDLSPEQPMGTHRHDALPVTDKDPDAALASWLSEARHQLSEVWHLCSERRRQAFLARHQGDTPLKSYRVIGASMGVTGEAVRRMVCRVWRDMERSSEAAQRWASTAAESLARSAGPFISAHDFEALVADLLPDTAHMQGPVEIVLHQMLDERAGYTRIDESYVDQPTLALVELMQRCAQAISDEVGLVDENTLRSCLPDAEWQQHWDALISLCGLVRLPSGLALRYTNRARFKAAIAAIGQPATKHEIARACGSPEIPIVHLANCLSEEGAIIRATKTKWALRAWGGRAYTGVSNEIARMITEAGGAIDIAALTRELPSMFEVSPASVATYLDTARFVVKDGMAALADLSKIQLRTLEEAMSGRTAEGQLFWRFLVEERFFRGYSLARVPPELVSALGCRPCQRIRVPVRHPAESQPISAGWIVDAVGGCDVGRIADALRHLGAHSGDEALLIVNEDRSVSFRLVPSETDSLGHPRAA